MDSETTWALQKHHILSRFFAVVVNILVHLKLDKTSLLFSKLASFKVNKFLNVDEKQAADYFT